MHTTYKDGYNSIANDEEAEANKQLQKADTLAIDLNKRKYIN